jgi:hypothetical protein
MQRSDIERLDQFFGWFDFTTFVAAKRAGAAEWAKVAPPRSPGVYFFATASAPRARGESDIYYIGRADPSLRDRIGKYLYRVKRSAERERYGWVGNPNAPEQGIASLVEEGRPVEIGWLVTANEDAAAQTESEFLERYRDEHGEYPPNNRRGGAKV